jgi:hypothetical protein
VLRNDPNLRKNDKSQAAIDPQAVNPISQAVASVQNQTPNPIHGAVNPAAMTQFPMQGPLAPTGMPGFAGSVAQYPMHHFGMPVPGSGYPYVPTYPTPHGPHPFSFPQHYMPSYGPAPSRKRRYNWNEPISDPAGSDDTEAGPTNIQVAISYPLVSDWLAGLNSDEMRNRDNIPYAAYTEKLIDNGILRLDDLTRFSPTELSTLACMNIGTAARIADWAKADKSSLEGQERKGKKMRIQV